MELLENRLGCATYTIILEFYKSVLKTVSVICKKEVNEWTSERETAACFIISVLELLSHFY